MGEYQFKHAENVTRKFRFKALSNNDSTSNKTITFSKNETYRVQQVKVSEHETTPPEYFPMKVAYLRRWKIHKTIFN